MQKAVVFLILATVCITVTFAATGVNTPLTTEEKNLIVNYHNIVRSKVKPAAADMKTMQWDNALEVIARDWSVQCQGTTLLNHNDDRSSTYSESVGENIYGTSGQIVNTNLTSAIDLWFDEYKDYDYSSNKCKSGKVCGHYTQVVWAKSYKVGCAKTQCSNLTYGGVFICNYGPSGNFVGQLPYEKAVGAGSSNRATNFLLLLITFVVLMLI